MTVRAKTERGNVAWWGLAAMACLALLAPLTLADVPPLLDYPNHLARLFVLAFAPADPVIGRFYQPRWGIIPNLALDLTVPPFLKLFPIHDVGRIVIALTLLLPVAGAVAYHRALSGRLSFWPLGVVLFVYNGALLRGFLNFIASVGLALLFGAAWVGWRERSPALAIAVAAAGAVVLFFCHLTGVLFLAILIGGHEVAVLHADPRPARIVRRFALVIAIFAAPALLYAISDLERMQGAAAFRSAADKAHAALTPVMNYVWPLDLATAAFCVAVPVLCLARRWSVIPAQAALAIGALVILFLGLPAAFKATFDLDTRFIVMVAFLIPAALVPAALPRRAAWSIGIATLLLFATRMAVLMAAWHVWADDLRTFRAVIAPVQPGDVVLTVRSPRRTEPGIRASVGTAHRLSDGTVVDSHLPALLLIEHRAWWPFLFDNLSQQPVQTREPFRTLAEQVDGSSDPIALLTGDVSAMRLFTHVLIVGPTPGPEEIATWGLRLLTVGGDAALFAVNRSRPRAPPPDR